MLRWDAVIASHFFMLVHYFEQMNGRLFTLIILANFLQLCLFLWQTELVMLFATPINVQ
jgi:hypothetical protein